MAHEHAGGAGGGESRGGGRPQSGQWGGAAPGAAAFAQKHPWMCLCEGGGSTPAILRRESLSFHLRAHAMRTMEGRGDNARWVECELGCENISAQPLHLHPPPPSSRAVYEAMQSTMC